MAIDGLKRVGRGESLGRQAYRALKQAIFNRGLHDGEKLTEIELARRLGLSRTPVHEAVTRLEMEGLVELDGSGLTIRFNERQVEEIYDLRCLLEGFAVRLAAKSMPEDTLAKIVANHESSATIPLGDFEERAAANAEFHWLVLAACGNSQLIRLLEGFREYYPSKDLVRRYDEHLSAMALEQHSQIIAALKAGDGERAEAAYRQHLNLARTEILKGDNDGIP